LQERKQEKDELEATLEDIAEQKQELAEAVDALQEQREELLQYKNVDEKIAETAENLDNITEKLAEEEERKEALDEDYSEERMEHVEEALDTLATVEDLLELREEKAEREAQLEQVEEQIEETEFDEEQLAELREQTNAIEKRQEVLANDIENKEEMLAERQKRLAELEQKQERIEQYEEQVDAYRAKNERLNQLLNALERTQVDLRNQFISSVNEMMDDIWQHVYPYDDYERIRLNAEDGYLLEVLDAEGNWIAVDGEVSGGERHAGALTLRIALSILLTPTWRLLILDEPTHNLDVTAIEELAETLRTEVSDIVGQLFLITHEERLETAVTGELYKLSKNDTETGLTAVEQVTGME
jgi:DNA repair exonuclease SbcCD ATPase subunit